LRAEEKARAAARDVSACRRRIVRAERYHSQVSNVTSISAVRPTVLEFFAGIGLARLGLEKAGFKVAWSNDFEADKKAMYEGHFQDDARGTDHAFVLGDVGQVKASDLPSGAAIAWASSPCTDLSLAGGRAGFAGAASGTFWHFIRLLRDLKDERPEVVVLENVAGLATSHGGEDIAAAIRAFNDLGYSVDVLAIDARRFVPQSRPRLFLVGAQNPPEDNATSYSELRPDWLQSVYGDPTLRMHRAELPDLPAPLLAGLGEVVEDIPLIDERWWDADRTASFVASLSPTQRERLDKAKRSSTVKYRTAYRRTRNGVAVWEVRPDDISGCLRTARGGSSKQAVVRMGNKRLQVRWMTPVEYARLMGAGEYSLDSIRTNQALFGFGDAVAVPAVEWLAENYLMPLVNGLMQGSTLTVSAANGQ
jgi:DNA (cytosine-5)-methyltransferase 1